MLFLKAIACLWRVPAKKHSTAAAIDGVSPPITLRAIDMGRRCPPRPANPSVPRPDDKVTIPDERGGFLGSFTVLLHGPRELWLALIIKFLMFTAYGLTIPRLSSGFRPI